MRNVATVLETNSDAIEFLLDKSQAGAEWVGENESRNETTNPSLDKLRIPAHELHAQVPATQKLLDDAQISIEQWLSDHVASQFGRTENAAFLLGNGVARPRGIMTYPTAATADG